MTEWVQQTDPGGCAAACLAMIVGISYEQAKAEIDAMPWTKRGSRGDKVVIEPVNWDGAGVSAYHLDRGLYAHGFYKQTRYSAWGYDITKPFAPIHWAIVEQPSKNHHFVVVLEDGAVLDPMVEEPRSLDDWSKVLQLCGLVRHGDSAA